MAIYKCDYCGREIESDKPQVCYCNLPEGVCLMKRKDVNDEVDTSEDLR